MTIAAIVCPLLTTEEVPLYFVLYAGQQHVRVADPLDRITYFRQQFGTN